MRHFNHLSDEKKSLIFEHLPQSFSKATERETLAYAVGATLYMPATQNFFEKLKDTTYKSLTSFVMCFEDAIAEADVSKGEENVRNTLRQIIKGFETGTIEPDRMPLFFLRARSPEQLQGFLQTLSSEEVSVLTGFTLPKFNSENALHFLTPIIETSNKFNTPLYGMPILESRSIIYREQREQELLALADILSQSRENILNVRVGGTDFSSLFALRRDIDTSIYDIRVVSECLTDIVNVFLREENRFVISAPVWEYFSNQRILRPRLRITPFADKKQLSKREALMDKAIDGLIREVVMDKANGFVGKTIIHPSHIPYVNAFHAVTKEEYEDAVMILNSASGGVAKSTSGNKMNEMNPHMSWAKKMMRKAQIYGVLKENDAYVDLF